MAEYVVRHLAWDRRGATFPLSPLPKDFQALCLSYELAVAEEAAEDYELPELPQMIFYAMPLVEAERLGVLHGGALRTLESALTELHWSIFESWVWLYDDLIFEAQFQMKVAPQESSRAGLQEEGSEVELKGEGSAKVEGVATEFELPEMVQATFYAILLNEVIELGVVHGLMAKGLKSALVGLRWSSFEAWMSRADHKLKEA
ncbi:hypothetical protein Cgig2_019159 [Carnegiea gigantea]|uniref:Uncharacterized protein n=1 Tax=Carnegiea gigantea TaxID=171969 RepID=A0A9Q1GNA8_9CARY|nr:hypothetical protein Cgig2_019159 [Carnegiea gigantea]